MKFTPNKIDSLESNEIFVFGSNDAGRHSKGVALIAARQFGASYGKVGLSGNSYALPTSHKDGPMSLEEVKTNVDTFLDCVKAHPTLTFYLTKIGCGSYTNEEIAPLFQEGLQFDNLIFPKEFYNLLVVA